MEEIERVREKERQRLRKRKRVMEVWRKREGER